MRKPGKSSSKVERNVKERSRRMRMKDLLSKLFSFMQIKPLGLGGKIPLLPLLEKSTSYLKQLKARVEKLKEMKEQLLKESEGVDNESIIIAPVVEVKEMDSIMEVNLISGLDKSITLHQIISVLQEEGAEVTSATYSTVGHRIIYIIQFQALWSRIGIEVSTLQQKLMQLVSSA